MKANVNYNDICLFSLVIILMVFISYINAKLIILLLLFFKKLNFHGK